MMGVLTIEHEGRRRAAVLPRRVRIGRRSMNHLVIDHRTVSRLHAWVDATDEGVFITDAGSRTGTRVNGRPIESRHPLADGDEVSIGPAKLTFRAEQQIPPGV